MRVVEPTGSETHVVMDMNGSEIVIVLHERQSTTQGQSLTVRPSGHAVHVFDKTTGQRLSD